jgi:putative sigma-54 modulation protein
MEITVRGKHFEVPEAAAERARNKFGKLDHFLPLLAGGTVEVDLAHERSKDPGGRYTVHAFVRANGVHLRAEERAAKLELAIDQAAHVLSEQARRHKTRLYGKTRHSARPSPLSEETRLVEDLDDLSDDALARITRVERVPLKPMTVEEALEQFELLGGHYLVFLEGETRRFLMLYRSPEDGYVLVIPELS